MNTAQLECFVQVAANLNFRRAAEELHLSQPTVSKQVAALEDEVGGALFVRSTRSVALTALGESFLQDANEILRLMYASSEKARRLAAGETLVIGYADPTELPRLSPVLHMLRKEERGLVIALRQAPRDLNVEQLVRERVDLVLGYESAALMTAGIAFERLRDDPLSCVVRTGSPLAKLESADAASVEGFPQVVCLPPGLRRRGYTAQGSIPTAPEGLVTHCQTVSEALCLVDAGMGYALLPSVQVPAWSAHACIPWEGSPRASYGVYLREGDDSALVRTFLNLAAGAYAVS